MGKRQRDCVECGAPVGFLDRGTLLRCMRRPERAECLTRCPGCGSDRVLVAGTGRCAVLAAMSRPAAGRSGFRGEVVVSAVPKRVERAAARMSMCRAAANRLSAGFTGWCGPCSRPQAPEGIRPGSARTAVNYAATLGAACAGDAGSAIPGPAFRAWVRPWPPGLSNLPTGSINSWFIWLRP